MNRISKKKTKFSTSYLAESFLDYYKDKGHTVVPSAPLKPADPTLLFTAAGMVPFKAHYSDPDGAPYSRAASVQKCLRAGGKQSDLENVGRTLRHHTFFEMLGNFSFGDYFKKEAIDTAWDLSVNVWGIDKERIWVSVYHEDDEAFDLWTKRIGVPKERMVRLGKEDNFWGPVGDTGVCGPSSELYFDTGRDLDNTKNSKPGDDDERFIEFWNLVFPQFFYTEAGKFDPLPKPGIDTGMGLERLAFILQKVEDNYHTDLFLPIRNAVAGGLPKSEKSDKYELALNAASDHVRALVFALSEGIYPSNEGRGYVLRRLLRRAATKLHPFGAKEPVLAPAVDAVIDAMRDRYPELEKQRGSIKKMITAEEEHFLSTLDQGWNRLQDVIESSRKKKNKTIPGRDAFVLYDTFGFPFELTAELAVDAGLKVDEPGYVKAMEEQKERSRKVHKFAANESVGVSDKASFTRIGKPSKDTKFIGYKSLKTDADLDQFREIRPGVLEVTTDRTVFYPVGGGQVADTGTLKIGNECVGVIDVFRDGAKIVHAIEWQAPPDGSPVQLLESNPRVELTVDRDTRLATARNHTGTHLLHRALRDVLGDHVTQAGSLVAPDRLRFDFHHYQSVTAEELTRIEEIVNNAILEDMSVTTETVSHKAAMSSGAMALFGEKYGDKVRVVSIEDFSKELCGGTHLKHTGEIGVFVTTHETSVAAGVRRIEALTGKAALGYLKNVVGERDELAGLLNVTPSELTRRVRTLYEENEALKKKLRSQEGEQASGAVAEALAKGRDVNGTQLVTYRADTGDLGALRKSGDEIRDKMKNGVGLLCLVQPKKSMLLIVASDQLIKDRGLRADTLAKDIGAAFALRGGGKPHMAQLGLDSPANFEKIIKYVEELLG